MNATEVVGWGLVASLVAANLFVSVAVGRCGYYGSRQKAAQIALIWLIPLIGAISVGIFLYSQRDNTKYDTRAYPEPSEKAISFTIHESIQGHDHTP